MNQGKLEVVKQEMARVNIDFLGISKLKLMEMGEFNSDDHYIYYCGQESLRRNGVAIMVNKRIQNAVLGCNLKNDRMISVHFQGKPFNITVIQVYVPTSNAEEAEAEQFYEDLQDFLELTPRKDVLLIIGAAAAAAKSLQSCPTLCDPRDSTPPGSPVPGILQARTLEWVAISFSNAWKWKVKVKSLSRVRLLATPWTAAYQAPPSMGFARQECWSGLPLPSPSL